MFFHKKKLKNNKSKTKFKRKFTTRFSNRNIESLFLVLRKKYHTYSMQNLKKNTFFPKLSEKAQTKKNCQSAHCKKQIRRFDNLHNCEFLMLDIKILRKHTLVIQSLKNATNKFSKFFIYAKSVSNFLLLIERDLITR